MADVFLALMRSLASLGQGRVWRYILAPAAFSLVLWLALAIWGLGAFVDWLLGHPPMTWVAGWGAVWLAHLLAYLGGWMVIFALAYLTTSLLAAILIMPWLLDHVAATDYAQVRRMGADSFAAAVGNSLVATLLFVLAWLATIPLWLIPGLSLLIPLLLMAWLNRRTFAYDATSLHATPEEWQQLRRQYKGPLLMLGLIMAILAHIPIVGLLAPALAALAYIHFCLEALRRMRGDAVIVGEARRIEDDPALGDGA